MDFDHADVYKLDIPDGHKKISPGNKKKILITFSPVNVGEYETKIRFKSKLETKELSLKGIGADFRLEEDKLPAVLDFERMQLTERVEKSFDLVNDCNYVLDFNLKILYADESLVNFFTLTASTYSGTIPGNSPGKDK